MRLAVLATVVFAMSGFAARADTFVYNVNASFTGGATVKGTLTLDNTTGMFTAANITNAGFAVNNGFSNNGTYTAIGGQGVQSGQGIGTTYFLYFVGTPAAYIGEEDFDFNVTSLVGYTNSSIPVSYISVDAAIAAQITATSSSVALPPAAVAVTPEPSSIALLGTGLLGVAGVVRKRFA